MFAGGVGIDDASVVAAPEGSNLLCFPVACQAPTIRTKGVVVQMGCAAGGAIGDTCRLGCSIGYDETEAVEGSCVGRWLEHEEVAVAEYANQAVTCTPARNADGSMVRARFLLKAARIGIVSLSHHTIRVMLFTAAIDCRAGRILLPDGTDCGVTGLLRRRDP